jgi:hypothetical protein
MVRMDSFENIKLSLDDEFYNEFDLEGVMISPVSAQKHWLHQNKKRILLPSGFIDYYKTKKPKSTTFWMSWLLSIFH